jgi:hypothetical protein
VSYAENSSIYLFNVVKSALFRTSARVQFCFFHVGNLDPCRKDPCQNLAGAIVDSCIKVGASDFMCQCQAGFAWNDESNSCDAGKVQ